MGRPEKLRDAVSAVLADPEKTFQEFDKNLGDLTPRSAIDETIIPVTPRFFWLDARQSFVFALYAGSVLLAGMSIEIAVRQFLERFIERRASNKEVASMVASVLEELDFRKIVGFCKDRRLFGDDKVYEVLHKCYDIRTKYSHAKISSILGSWGSEPVNLANEAGESVEHHKLREDEFLTGIVVTRISAREDALAIIGLAQEALEVIFGKSGYYTGAAGQH